MIYFAGAATCWYLAALGPRNLASWPLRTLALALLLLGAQNDI